LKPTKSTEEVEKVLGDLIKFCTTSEIQNPLEREGTPIPQHQKLIAVKVIYDKDILTLVAL
jgi:hypothetical protein